MTRYRYRLYGVVVDSPWSLAWPAAEVDEPPDLVVCHAGASAFTDVDPTVRDSAANEWDLLHHRLDDGRQYLRWGSQFEFLVGVGGTRVLGRPLRRARLEAFRTYLFSQVLSFALIECGEEPLHVSAVAVGDRAIGLMGQPGAGKSTLAAEFLREGAGLLTDDLLVIQRHEGHLNAQPGPPRIKLFPEVAHRVLPGMADGVPVSSITPKSIIRLRREQWRSEASPLAALYVLRPGGGRTGRVSIRTPTPRTAFLELTRNTFNPLPAGPERLRRQLELASTVANEVPVRSVTYPRDIDRLAAVRSAILRDLER
jgi:hypothetical protein